jgi:DNA-directed RNA polymerase subunit RPC12/RpoP
METVIDKGDRDKQGNAVCPQCGRKVLVDKHWGDPPVCPNCSVPYTPITQQPDYH